MTERIERIEKVVLRFKRPRFVGKNARRGDHGDTVTDPVVRIHTTSGAVGVGWSMIGEERARRLIGESVESLFESGRGSTLAGSAIDLPLWDLAARMNDQPLFQLIGGRGNRAVELYDSTIYIDDVDRSDEEAVAIFKDEVATGRAFGYDNFKIKVGRGARWMGIHEGLDRDVLVIKTVRDAAGPDAKIMIDANNGTVLNIAMEILRRCEDVGIYWFEEPFPEDYALSEAFKLFINERGDQTLVADGESNPPPNYFEMVEAGWIDVVQHDFRAKGLTWWKKTADLIAPWGTRCAPHCWGSLIERYTHAHFAASIPNFSMLEAAPAEMPGIVLDGWEQRDGKLIVPETPGIGFDIKPEVLAAGIEAEDGFVIQA